MTPLDRLAYDPKYSVWGITNPLLRALAMWVSVLVALPLFLVYRLVAGMAVGGFFSVKAHLDTLPWRHIGRVMIGREPRL